jgi:ATP-binding cassette subfamily B protein
MIMKQMKLLWNMMKGNRTLYVKAILAIGCATFLAFLWPVILRVTIDSVIGKSPIEISGWLKPYIETFFSFLGGREHLVTHLWLTALLLLGITLLQGLFLYFKGKWSAIASESIAKNIRDRLYYHLQHLPYDYHVKAKTGDIIQRCTSDVETIRRFIAVQFVEVGRAFFMIGLALAFMIPMHTKMTLVSMALVPLIFSFAYIFFQKVKSAFQESDEAEGRLSAVLQENLTGVRVVRAFSRQMFEIEKFDSKNREYRDKTFRLIWLLAVYWSSSDLVCLIQIGGVIILGTYWAAKGDLSLGTLLAFSSYVGMLLWPVRQLGRVLTDMGKTMVSVERINEILCESVETLGSIDQVAQMKGDIQFSNVSFAYEKGQPILQDVSFQVKEGQTIAILGPTGSGKSTLVHLLARLYEYDSGSISINGIELKSIDKMAVRKAVGLMLQETFLFSKSLQDNIGLAKENYEVSNVTEAAQIACVHEVIEKFEKGYETAVGERGVTLSGGQKQRVAIARMLMNDYPILIFDDSLSAVDTETDMHIRRELKKRNKNATTFIISHRLNTLAEADVILVLEHGRVTQFGSHSELLLQKGLYQRIWAIQSDLQDEITESCMIKKFEDLEKCEQGENLSA